MIDFPKLYQDHERKVLGLCVRLTKNYALGEDASQRAWLQVWRHRKAFKGKAAPSSWLYRIAYNESLMVLRREKKHRGCVGIEAALEMECPKVPSDPFERRKLMRIVKTLQSPMFNAVYGLDLECKDAAAMVGIPHKAAKSRLFREKSAFKKKWLEAA